MSYQRKLTKKVHWTVQLNASNIGQTSGMIPITIEPDGTTWAGLRMKAIQKWTLTNTFSF
jgi:hypothetical protein